MRPPNALTTRVWPLSAIGETRALAFDALDRDGEVALRDGLLELEGADRSRPSR